MKISTPEELAQAVRNRRKLLKATQKDLAMTAGTGLRFIIDLEKGKPTCQIAKVFAVLQVLGLRVFFHTDDGDPA